MYLCFKNTNSITTLLIWNACVWCHVVFSGEWRGHEVTNTFVSFFSCVGCFFMLSVYNRSWAELEVKYCCCSVAQADIEQGLLYRRVSTSAWCPLSELSWEPSGADQAVGSRECVTRNANILSWGGGCVLWYSDHSLLFCRSNCTKL